MGGRQSFREQLFLLPFVAVIGFVVGFLFASTRRNYWDVRIILVLTLISFLMFMSVHIVSDSFGQFGSYGVFFINLASLLVGSVLVSRWTYAFTKERIE